MDKKLLSLSLILSFFVSSVAFAQPEEELPVITVQEMSEEEKRLFLPAEESAVQVEVVEQQQVIPVAENTETLGTSSAPITVGGVVDVAPPAEALKKEEPVEGGIKGLNFGAGVDINPFGFDYLNGHRREYFKISPNLSLGTKFLTDSKKAIDFKVSYYFAWQEFVDDEDPTGRAFVNGGSLGFSGKFNDQWSYSFGLGGEWFMLAGTDQGSDNYIVVYSSPTAKMKINDQASLSLTYYFDYLQLPNASVSLIDSIGGDFDTDGFGGGLFSDAVFGSNTDDLGSFGLVNDEADLAWIENKLGFTFDWKPIDGTSLRLNYRYAFNVFSNNPDMEYKGHFIRPKVTQAIPNLEGGKLSYEMRVRLRTYDSALQGDEFKANRRFRHIFGYSQKITDSWSGSLSYRVDVNSSNKDNFAKKTVLGNMFAMGLSYSF